MAGGKTWRPARGIPSAPGCAASRRGWARGVNPIPDSLGGVTPGICMRDAAKAIEFYKKAFGATEVMKFIDPASGKVAHAEMKIADRALFMLSEQYPGFNHCPEAYGGTTVTMYVYVEDVDRFIDRAVAAGAKLIMPVKD